MILACMMPWPLTPESHCCNSPFSLETHFQAFHSEHHLLNLQLTCFWTLTPTFLQTHRVLKSTDLTYHLFTDPQPLKSSHFLPGIKSRGPSLWSFSRIHPQFPCLHLPLLFSPGNPPTQLNPPLYQHWTCNCEAHYSWRKATSSFDCYYFLSGRGSKVINRSPDSETSKD